MNESQSNLTQDGWPKLAVVPVPAKVLITSVILTMAIAMFGALGQIIVHDIIPTFFAEEETEEHAGHGVNVSSMPESEEPVPKRGDLFSTTPVEEKPSGSFYTEDQFVWTLKWTHIHLFGMNLIFILMGAITLLLNLSARVRSWLIALPFVGVLIDIASVWLKGYVASAFFWLHVPGGVLFAVIFIFVSLRALWEMWFSNSID